MTRIADFQERDANEAPERGRIGMDAVFRDSSIIYRQWRVSPLIIQDLPAGGQAGAKFSAGRVLIDGHDDGGPRIVKTGSMRMDP